jgi:hypothetical protein
MKFPILCANACLVMLLLNWENNLFLLEHTDLKMKKSVLFISVLCLSLSCYATHIKGGRIEARYESGIATYRIIITIYTDIGGILISADQSFLDSVHFGDGSTGLVPRISYNDQPGNIRINTYEIVHNFPGAGTYLIDFSGPNRTADILNIPHSVTEPIYLSSQLVIPATACVSNSPHLFYDPEFYFPAFHDVHISRSAFDYERDSLSYSLVPCMNYFGTSLAGYSFPPGVSLNALTGEFNWQLDSIAFLGTFSFDVKINKWKRSMNGTNISMGYIIEEFQIILTTSVFGNFNFDTSAFTTDSNGNFSSSIYPDSVLNITIHFSGFDSSSSFIMYTNMFDSSEWSMNLSGDSLTGNFSWHPSLENASRQPYTLIVHANPENNDFVYLVYVNGIYSDSCFSVISVNNIVDDNLLIQPNPVYSFLKIKFGDYAKHLISVFDLQGRLIIKDIIMNEKNFPVSDFANGVYILKININGNILTRKFVVAKLN